MSTLEQQVLSTLGAEGVQTSADRGAILCEIDGLQVAMWCDEVQRTIKAEASLVYPVDDFSPDLAGALDYLNKNRAGVSYAYREAQRDLVAATAWSSPNREPSANQIYLLVGLLTQAFDRDAGQLQGVAEGEFTWEDLAQDPQRRAEQLSPFGGRAARGAAKVEQGTARWQSFMGDEDSPATGRAPSTKFQRDPSAKIQRGPSAKLQRGPSAKAQRSNLPTRRLEDGPEEIPTRRFRSDEDERVTTGGGTLSRNALQIAVAQADSVRPPTINYHRESIFARMLRGLFILAVVGGVGYVLWIFFIQPFVPNDWKQTFYTWFETKVMEEQEILQRDRALMQGGPELLRQELANPLADAAESQRNIDRSLEAIGDGLAGLLENELVTSTENQTRGRIHALWDKKGFGTPEGVMRLLKRLSETPVQRSGDDPVNGPLLDQIRNGTIKDEAIIAALPWAKGETFEACVSRLGRDAPAGLEERAAALQGVLERDTEDRDVLLALIKTGRGPADSALRLIEGLGAEWARTQGREQLLRFLSDEKVTINSAFSSEKPEVCLVALELALENRAEGTLELLSGVMRDHPLEEVREAAVGALPSLGPAAAWPLTEELGLPDVPDARKELARKALRSIAHDLAAEELKQHLAPERSARERYLAVIGLTEIQGTPGVNVLVEVGLRDPDYRVRLRVLRALDSLKDELKSSVRRGLSEYRALALEDDSAPVREMAAALYRHFQGRDPR
ncbi:MAG: HEAT repeat domain-containing protein [Planctomycetes bacterium]|nr:HEAT repeat domain-containing protein [Planctomycetota bacterium]